MSEDPTPEEIAAALVNDRPKLMEVAASALGRAHASRAVAVEREDDARTILDALTPVERAALYADLSAEWCAQREELDG